MVGLCGSRRGLTRLRESHTLHAMVSFSSLASLSLLLSFITPLAVAQAADPAPMQLSLPEILRLPKGRAAVYTPLRLKQGDSLSLTTLQITDGTSRQPNSSRGLQISVFAADPGGTGYTIRLQEILVSSATSPSPASEASGNGAGKVSMNDFSFANVPAQYRFADGSVRLLVTAVGFEINGASAKPQPAPLPKELALSAQLDQAGIALLLPAVQKVREAAARL